MRKMNLINEGRLVDFEMGCLLGGATGATFCKSTFLAPTNESCEVYYCYKGYTSECCNDGSEKISCVSYAECVNSGDYKACEATYFGTPICDDYQC